MTMNVGLTLHGMEVARRQIGDWLLSVTQYEAGSRIQLHSHELPYATVILRGGYEETSAGRSRDCAAQSIVVHPPEERHADRFVLPTACLNIHGGGFETGALISPAMAGGIAAKLQREFLKPDEFSPQIVEALMLELHALGRRSGTDLRVPSWLGEIRRRVELDYQTPITVTTLAGGAGVHPSHLARSFRHHYGMTVGEMVRQRRVERSMKELLGGLSVADIAMQLGFSDQSHFTRVFRRATGMTPAAFRRSSRSRPR